MVCVRGAGPTRLTLEPLAAELPDGRQRRIARVRPRSRRQTGRGADRAPTVRSPSRPAAPSATTARPASRASSVYRVRGGGASGSGPIGVVDAHPRTEACWENLGLPRRPRRRPGRSRRDLHRARTTTYGWRWRDGRIPGPGR
ncbi:hypothetical protein ACRAWF_18565 [Streptomyces sp. L7]